MRPASLAAGLAISAGALALSSAPAYADVCPGGLTVAGKPVTGDDCVTQGDGSVQIKNPRFGASGAVKIVGGLGGDAKMILNAARTQMVGEVAAEPLQLRVGDKPLMIGTVEIAQHEFCDVGTPRDPAQLAGLQAGTKNDDGSVTQFSGEAFIPTLAGCRQLPSFKFDLGLFDQLGKLAGLDLGGERVFADIKSEELKFTFSPDNPDKTTTLGFTLPRVFGFDDDRGGRVFGIVNVRLPKPFTFKQNRNQTVGNTQGAADTPIRLGIGLELNAESGIRPTSVGIDIPKDIPLPVPGVKIRDLLAIVDPANNRFGGGARLVLPGNKAFGGEAIVANGALEKLGFDIAFPTPGVPLFPIPGVLTLAAIGGTFTSAQDIKGVGGITQHVPAAVQGRFKATIGPSIAGQGPLALNAAMTVGGPAFKLNGDITAIADKLKLGAAKITIGTDPFRFEADASVNALSAFTGRMFVGVTESAFTGLGEVSVQIPKEIKFVGGQKLGGFQGVVSNVGVGGLITIDPPLVKAFSLGLGSKWTPFKITTLSSLSPFITVKPSAVQATVARAARRPVALAAAQRTLRLPGGDAVITVSGTKRLPRSVVVRNAKGRKLRTVVVGRGGKDLELGVVAPKGKVTVSTRDAVARLTASRLGTFPYLDPSPGPGTRPSAPVTAGTPVRICWKTKGNRVPRTAAVDVFEDQNGSLGTGRQLASGRAANGCLDIPTDGLEPGRHWAYGVLRIGDRLLGTRYWPIPIVITDPKALPAPAGTQIVTTADGAQLAIPAIAGADSYLVTAEPVDEYDGEPLIQDVAGADRFAALSLRGARRWNVSVQAVGSDGRKGNATDPVLVAPTDPVVLAGKPNAVAEVAKKWAFALDTDPGETVALESGPPGMRIEGGAALLQWTPSVAAGQGAPQQFSVRACKGERCVSRSFDISAYAKNIAPFGPARGFTVSPNVLPAAGGVVTVRAQGIDEAVVVKVDGKVVKAKRVDGQTVTVKVGALAKGRHEVTLKVGGDLEERRPGALVVL